VELRIADRSGGGGEIRKVKGKKKKKRNLLSRGDLLVDFPSVMAGWKKSL